MEPTKEVWKIIFLFNWEIFKFHLNYQGCAGLFASIFSVCDFAMNVHSECLRLLCFSAMVLCWRWSKNHKEGLAADLVDWDGIQLW